MAQTSMEGYVSMSKPTNQIVQFRLIEMPCCHTLICWVNPRRPMYCPECGTRIFNCFPKVKWENTYSEATLRVEDEEKSDYFKGNPPQVEWHAKGE
jgi:hypothetical protein